MVCACVCASACVYVCVIACMYVFIYVCMYLYMYVCMYVCMYTCMCVRARASGLCVIQTIPPHLADQLYLSVSVQYGCTPLTCVSLSE